MTNEQKLAPCPFCGERATVVYRHNPMSKWKYSADCTSTECGACGPVEATRKDAATAWNTRADLALALVAEAYEVAGDAAADAYDANDLPTGSDMAGFIRSLTPADAIAARDARVAEVRRKALEDAAGICTEMRPVTMSQGYTEGYDCALGRAACRILALIEKGQTNE